MATTQTASPKFSGPWSAAEVQSYLEEAVIPIRVSAVSAVGWPSVVSLWFQYDGSLLYCACRRSARVVELLRRNPKCGFEIAGETPPYFGVRGQGEAEIDEAQGAERLRGLIDRYIGSEDTKFRRWLLQGATNEVAIVIRPRRIMSWDYRSRMTSGV